MALNDTLANCLAHIHNCEKVGKSECYVGPVSNMLMSVLKILKENDYIGDFEVSDERRGGLVKINLIGGVNNCGVVKPRFSFTKENYEMFEKRYLPANGFGLFVVSTSKGVMTHKEALDKKVGGKLIAYCY